MEMTSFVELKFGENDLTYGPKAGGALRAWQIKHGGKLLEDVSDVFYDGFGADWIGRSIHQLKKFTARGNKIRFDLTYMADLDGVLNNIGKYAEMITSQELRYIRDNWKRLNKCVIFYKNNKEVPAPWLN